MGDRVWSRRAAMARAVFSSLLTAGFLFALSAITHAQAPGGLFVGYYHEDPATNPEDPFPGALYLSLPSADGMFAGTMYFTYFGCQKVSAGSISGSKNQESLAGRWSGPVDNTFQAGSFSGTYSAAAQRYAGTYTVDGGKQYFDLRPCVQYFIASNGTWEASPVGVGVPSSFAVSINGSQVSWSPTPGATLTLIAIVDQSLATSGSASAVKWQTLFMSPYTITDLSAFGQTLGPNDVVMVAAFDSLRRRIAFGSKSLSNSGPPNGTLAPLAGMKAIGAGTLHTCALTSAGGVKCWCGYAYGHLGDSTFNDHMTPADVDGLTSGVTDIAAGTAETCARTNAGGVKCWGFNHSTEHLTPADVDGLTGGVMTIAVGHTHTCALTIGGGVKCWGWNNSGELGDNTQTNRPIPVDVVGLNSGVKAISAGGSHTCALTTTGGIKCWGWNAYGQVGDNTLIDRLMPVDVVGLTSGVKAISAGGSHTCALTTTGGVKCWGDNRQGQLGDNSLNQHPTPVAVVGLTNGVTAISAGGLHSCVLTTAGGVKCWGNGGRGMLGDGTGIRRLLPVDVYGLTRGIVAISASGYGDHTCALTTTGGVKCWGWNHYGQLGDNSLTDRLTPVDVLTTANAPSPSPTPVPSSNFQGLWWSSPAGSESGWGINFAHQGDVIFVTWFTYDTAGKALWLSMTANKTADGVYEGTLYQTRGPAFNAVPFSPGAVTAIPVGMGKLTLSDGNNGSFAYAVNGVTQTKIITRQVFGPLPTCTFAAQADLSLATNYQDLWWAAPAGIESGWGVNFTHQGDIIFATWFTYDADGTPLWLSATVNKSAPGVYTGTLYRTTGPAFNAVPFLPANVSLTVVGTLTLTFGSGNSATFAYALNGVVQAKQITRQVFRAPGTMCQ